VLGAALNVACAGGEPLALTDCLNFGNPERAEIAWELAQAIDGIAAAADELGIPVVSGNVSLYNETGGTPIPPTPVVGCVGLVHDLGRLPAGWQRGDRVLYLTGVGAALVDFVWRQSGRFSLCHDVSGGDLRRGLAQASSWSGLEPAFLDDDAAVLPTVPGVIVALRPDDGARLDWPASIELGVV
jgi:phosphoribosylformylglycinamidine (FGAM) synthase-like enzyme